MNDHKFRVSATPTKLDEIHAALNRYWENDRWDIRDPFLDEYRPKKWTRPHKVIDFSQFRTGIKDEIKLFFAYRIFNKTMRLQTAVVYGTSLNSLSVFLNKHHPSITSLIDIAYEKFLMQWRSYLINQGHSLDTHGRLSSHSYETLFNQLYLFLQNFYDDREEFEKDIWDVRKIPGAKFTDNRSGYLISFLDIPLPYRQLAKQYLKVRISRYSQIHCWHELFSLRLFFNFIYKKYPEWQDVKLLTRKNIEEYLSWFRSYIRVYCWIAIKVFG